MSDSGSTLLRLSPPWSHAEARTPPESRLTAETAFEAYEKLRPFLAIASTPEPPAGGWKVRGRRLHDRSLFLPDGFHRPVRWLPKADETSWRRLRYDEFCAYYGLYPFDGDVVRKKKAR